MNESNTSSTVRDSRRPAFCFQTHDALDLIREHFTGSKRSTALAVYVVLTETANRYGGADARNGFQASRKEIAEAAGVSVDTLDRYAKEFEQMGLIEVERVKVGAVNLPNEWALSDPPSRTGAARVAAPVRPFARAIPSREETTPKKEVQIHRTRARDHWLSLPGMTQHRDSYFDSKINRKLDTAIGKYGVDDVCHAMTAYAEVLASDQHYWTHRWTLGDFLTRGLDKFVPEAQPYNAFVIKSKHPGGMTPEEIAAKALRSKEAER